MTLTPTSRLLLRLFRLALDYRWGCLRLVLTQFALLALSVASLALMGLAVDTIQAAVEGRVQTLRPAGLHPPADLSPMETVAVLSAALLVLAVIRAALNYHYAVDSARLLQQQIVVELRTRIYDKLQRLPPGFYGKNLSGSLIARVTGDAQAVRLFIDGVVLQMVIVVLALGFYLAYMLTIDVGLTLLCLATTPAIWIFCARFSRAVRPAYAKNRDLVDRMLLVLTENVLGVQVVKGLSRQPEEIEKFRAANAAVRDQKRSIFHRVSLFSPSVELLLAANQLALLGYGGYLVIEGQLPLGSGLLVFSGLLQQFSGQVTKVTNIINSVQESLAGAQRVFEILDAPAEVTSRQGARRLHRATGAIEFDRVSFGYIPDHPVLQQVSFRIEPGQCVAIFGDTGAGKTALLNLIPRFHDVTGGRLLVDGVDVRDVDLGDLRRNVGVVYQESFLFSDTVRTNLAFGRPEAAADEVRRAAGLAAADAFITRLPDGYGTLLRERGKDLSGGQRQRMALARTLLVDSPILLLDDPTSAVDATTEHEILTALRQARPGRTVLIAAHRPSTLAFADLILVLQGGRIVQMGTHQQLWSMAGPYRYALQRPPGSDPVAEEAASRFPRRPRAITELCSG